MDVTLSVQADTLSDEGLQDVTRDLCTTLNRETEVQAELVEVPAKLGTRTGELPLLGTIALGFLTETTAKIVVEILFSYCERNPALRRLIFKDRERGKELPLSRESLQPEHLQRTIDSLRDFTKGPS